MPSRALTILAAVVVVVVGLSVAIGMTAPDGSVRDTSAPNVVTSRSTPTPTATTSPTSDATDDPQPTPSATSDFPTIDLAPAQVAELWAGRPKSATLSGNKVDWCPAVDVSRSSAATATFGKAKVDSGACAAIKFVFNERYSKRSLPKDSYKKSDFDSALASVATATADASYKSRIATFVANPSTTNGENLGLVMLRGQPGGSYRYYQSYADRSAWINPKWSTVTVSVDHSRANPRLVTSFTASAAVPVYDKARGRDAMMTVPTRATISLRREDGRWKISSFQIRTEDPTFGSLDVR